MKMTAEAVSSKSNEHENWGEVLEVAAHEVFELMLGSKLTKPNPLPAPAHEITAMIGLAGQLCGVMNLRCSVKASTLMASKMLGVPPNQIGPEGCDAFGEVCNMIAGNFKNKISGLGDGCMLSVPTVITGNDYSLHAPTASEALSVTLLFEAMPITISLQIHS